MKRWIAGGMALAAFLLQTTVLQQMRTGCALFNLTLIVTVAVSLRWDRSSALAAALTGGVLQDLFFSPALGLHVLIYATAAGLITSIKGQFFKESPATPLLMILFATLYYYMILIGVYYFAGRHFELPAVLLKLAGPELLYNSLVCWIVCGLFGRVADRFGLESDDR